MYRCLLGLRIVSSDRDNEPVAQLKFVQAELPYVPVQDRSSFVRAQTAIVGHTQYRQRRLASVTLYSTVGVLIVYSFTMFNFTLATHINANFIVVM